ncbi:MAG: bifunctional adenosylcobinamide kinase/adenosylcobinamide-phosphate guanylyltransferase, partial [Solirubrobacteraceae bacterium]
MTLTLVMGGTRSGKSARAEQLALASGLPVRYVATADSGDAAMAERISTHAARRPREWDTVEADARLADALAGAEGMCVLVDGLGVWIAGAMHRGRAFEHTNGQGPDQATLTSVREEVLAQVEELVRAAAAGHVGSLIVVAEQAGEGVLPAEQASRAWLDTLGEATQRLAGAATSVELVVAGRPLQLAGPAPAARVDTSSA